MYRCRVPVEVRFRDLDSLGHVNNAVYLTYFEVARIAYIARLGLSDPVRPTMLLARIEVDYLRPVHLGEPVEIGLRTSVVGTKSFTLDCELTASGEPAARAKSVQVWFDPAQGRSVPIPDEVRAKIAAFEGGSPPRPPGSEEG